MTVAETGLSVVQNVIPGEKLLHIIVNMALEDFTDNARDRYRSLVIEEGGVALLGHRNNPGGFQGIGKNGQINGSIEKGKEGGQKGWG